MSQPGLALCIALAQKQCDLSWQEADLGRGLLRGRVVCQQQQVDPDRRQDDDNKHAANEDHRRANAQV